MLALPGGLSIQMQRLRIVGHGREQQIVRFGDSSPYFMAYPVANNPLVEIFACHAALTPF
jgi:hypothetical protein